MYINTDELKKRRKRLEEIKAEIKQELFGLDEVIDNVVDSIRSWYLLPQIITHPIIINLFGLTGVGKTQLIRLLVEKLEFQDRFVEVQMDGVSGGSTFSRSSICEIIQSSKIQEKTPGIVLLDEFQRFRTLDEDGNEIKVSRFQDVWQLLSDGKFSADLSIFSKIEDYLAYAEFEASEKLLLTKEERKEEEAEDKKNKKKKYKISPYEAKTIKRTFKLRESLEEVMTWTPEKVLSLYKDFDNKKHAHFSDYSKCLIFVCGNLDEAFASAASVEDADTDADLFYKMSKQINISHIKGALKSRFKPEQIARLGNNIIIYPSLDKKTYYKIIEKDCQKYINEITKISGLNFRLDHSVFDEIYFNSVFPSQGTRPVFSSVHMIFSSSLSEGVLWAVENGLDNITISLNAHEHALIFTAGNKKKVVKVLLRIRQQKTERTKSFNSLVAVHEAGHAVTHALLTKTCPFQVAINLTSFEGGHVITNSSSANSREQVLNSIRVCLAGMCAEELVFGAANRTIGCENDIGKATRLAGQYVRRWAYDEEVAWIGRSSDAMIIENAFEDSNAKIESLLQNARDDVAVLLFDNKVFLKNIASALLKKNKLDACEFQEIAIQYIPDVSTKNEEVSIDYHKMLKDFE